MTVRGIPAGRTREGGGTKGFLPVRTILGEVNIRGRCLSVRLAMGGIRPLRTNLLSHACKGESSEWGPP